MKLRIKQTRAAILPLCLLALCGSIACGDDDAMDKEVFEDAAVEGATANKQDGGTGNTAGKADAGGTSVTPPSTKPDGGTSKPPVILPEDDDELSVDPGNTLYKDGPACPGYGGKIEGTVEGTAVKYILPAVGRTESTSLELSEDEESSGLLRLDWSPALKAGTLSMITKGQLVLSNQYSVGPYCVMEGKAQLDPTMLGDNTDERLFITITKLKKRVAGECVGEDLTADLKLCNR